MFIDPSDEAVLVCKRRLKKDALDVNASDRAAIKMPTKKQTEVGYGTSPFGSQRSPARQAYRNPSLT